VPFRFHKTVAVLTFSSEPFEEKMPRLVAELQAQFAEYAKLEQTIKANLKGLGYEL
jgi:hypothetical protein